MKLTSSTGQNIEQLSAWIAADPDHSGEMSAEWWVTGSEGSLLAFRLDDACGPLCYVRLDEKDSNGLIRLHTQFAPRQQVSKVRLIKGMLWCVPVVQKFCEQQNSSNIIFQSSNTLLVGFMKRKFRVQLAGGSDYILPLQASV
jgi:hypothetical protein